MSGGAVMFWKRTTRTEAAGVCVRCGYTSSSDVLFSAETTSRTLHKRGNARTACVGVYIARNSPVALASLLCQQASERATNTHTRASNPQQERLHHPSAFARLHCIRTLWAEINSALWVQYGYIFLSLSVINSASDERCNYAPWCHACTRMDLPPLSGQKETLQLKWVGGWWSGGAFAIDFGVRRRRWRRRQRFHLCMYVIAMRFPCCSNTALFYSMSN